MIFTLNFTKNVPLFIFLNINCNFITSSLCYINFAFQHNQDYIADEIGVLSPNQLPVDELYVGEVYFNISKYNWQSDCFLLL